jgi:hypothetical protein
MLVVLVTRSEPIQESIDTPRAQVEVRFLDPVCEIPGLDFQDGSPPVQVTHPPSEFSPVYAPLSVRAV